MNTVSEYWEMTKFIVRYNGGKKDLSYHVNEDHVWTMKNVVVSIRHRWIRKHWWLPNTSDVHLGLDDHGYILHVLY